MCDTSSAECRQWVDSALRNCDLINYQIELEGRPGQGEGYSSDIHFIKVTGQTKDGSFKVLHLAVKAAFKDEKLRGEISVAAAFLKEIYIYDTVKPTFEKFLTDRKLKEKISFLPHCYSTNTTDKCEFLIFENVKHQNFQLWDMSLLMTHKHTQLILDAYGKWHALSMALKTQKPEAFTELIKDQINMYDHLMKELNIHLVIWESFGKATELAFHEDEKHFLKHLQYSFDDVQHAFTDLCLEDTEYQVILHNDCWTNNYLFKNDDASNPKEVRIIDWQCSGTGSPVLDLSHFIYCCVDIEKYQSINQLLDIYYDSFSKYLTLLGCDSEEVYPFQKLIKQWKKLSHYGLFISCSVIRSCLQNPNDATDYQETIANGESAAEMFNMVPLDNKEFIRRMRNNFLHYCKHKEQ